ncbi:MAG: 4-hydroxy-3-methylbut-2-enyl diphosphate reductase [Lachnospiraceae bacterium]|nr:4-hydroxy-3-methylbut-2-enyl diphosphate reductase [Candidatus Equihabitans merdae]
MNVTIADTAGFCFGVKRAVDTVYQAIENAPSPIYTWGPIIHNEHVVGDFEKKGVMVLDEDTAELPSEGTVVIRSHGITRETQERLQASGMQVIDATCPFVQKIHQIVETQGKEGRDVIIVGNPSHPEVIGIKGWATGPCYVVSSVEDLKICDFSTNNKLCVVAQTTFNYEYFKEIVEIIKNLVYDVSVLNTICNATKERQLEARELAAKSDTMLVVGSKSSSNTQKLYSICKEFCDDTYYIQTLSDLVTVHFGSDNRVGITAGASTPNNIIQEVSQYVRRKEF